MWGVGGGENQNTAVVAVLIDTGYEQRATFHAFDGQSQAKVMGVLLTTL